MPKDPLENGYSSIKGDPLVASRKARAAELRKKIADMTAAQHYNKALSVTKSQKLDTAAIDHRINMKEQEAEGLEKE